MGKVYGTRVILAHTMRYSRFKFKFTNKYFTEVVLTGPHKDDGMERLS
jgi:hypothetical protein